MVVTWGWCWEWRGSWWGDVNLGHIISSVPLNHRVFWPFNTRHPHKRWPATGWSSLSLCPMPNHALPGSLNGAAHGTMRGRDVLSPESSLVLTAYLVLPPPGGFCSGRSVGKGYWVGPDLWAQQGSFRLSHIHWLLLSATSETDLVACRRACPWIPRSFRSLMVE